MNSYVIYSKAQLKIQQMAFVLVALMILFGIIALLYSSITLRSLAQEASSLNEEEAKEVVRMLSSTSEFISSNCENCIDLDKVLLLKYRKAYQDFWNLDFLRIEKLYPESSEKECDLSNYPDCSTITLINKENFGSPSTAFVSLCRWEGYQKCELGRIYASGKSLN